MTLAELSKTETVSFFKVLQIKPVFVSVSVSQLLIKCRGLTCADSCCHTHLNDHKKSTGCRHVCELLRGREGVCELGRVALYLNTHSHICLDKNENDLLLIVNQQAVNAQVCVTGQDMEIKLLCVTVALIEIITLLHTHTPSALECTIVVAHAELR